MNTGFSIPMEYIRKYALNQTTSKEIREFVIGMIADWEDEDEEVYEHYTELERIGASRFDVSIPNNATNAEVLKVLFPRDTWKLTGDDAEWGNKPYEGGYGMRPIDGDELAKVIAFFEEEPASPDEPPIITQIRKDFMQFQKEKIESLKEELGIS